MKVFSDSSTSSMFLFPILLALFLLFFPYLSFLKPIKLSINFSISISFVDRELQYLLRKQEEEKREQQELERREQKKLEGREKIKPVI